LACLFIASAGFCALYSQESGPVKFEAASVRLSDPQTVSNRITHIQSDAKRIDYHFIGIEQLITRAWLLHQNQIVWPESMATQADRRRAHYDISATMPEGTSPEQQRLMLRNLLSERLQLKAHVEMRDTKVYALEVSPAGLKIRKAQNPPPDENYPSGGMEVAKGQYWRISSPDRRAPDRPSGFTIFALISFIQQMFDGPLVDQTGLKGFYDLDLNVPLNPIPAGGSATPGDNSAVMPSLPAVSGALDKQLGIRVTPRTLPYEILVIEHLEMNPGGN
jgi:uncharacterized protein (TIGR03435 family)